MQCFKPCPSSLDTNAPISTIRREISQYIHSTNTQMNQLAMTQALSNFNIFPELKSFWEIFLFQNGHLMNLFSNKVLELSSTVNNGLLLSRALTSCKSENDLMLESNLNYIFSGFTLHDGWITVEADFKVFITISPY